MCPTPRAGCAWRCPTRDARAFVDAPLLERVVANLVGNAVKHTESTVTITVSALGNQVEVRVIDRGPGIPEEDWDLVFRPFQRLGDRDNTTGVGLGLALSRGLAEAMGGTLVPEDTPGGGITMVLSLPRSPRLAERAVRRGRREPMRRRRTHAAATQAHAGGRPMIRVLVVDDEPQLMRALRINLTARRYEVVVAADGAAALEVAARHLPDLVILDLGLPDMDGTEVIAGLRGWTKVPILVLSGRTDASDKVDALDAGADDYVTKPFSMEELMARLRALQRRAEAEAAARTSRSC